MDSSGRNGPDGSSLKPVSSLLAKFENLNKSTANASGPSPPRTTSPAPKPDRLRDAKTSPETTAAPPSKPRERANVSTLQLPPAHDMPPRSPGRSVIPPPTLSPKPIKPPSVLVEPPHSPPKGAVGKFMSLEGPSFLNPDSVVAPTTPSASPRPFKIPSRPHTPILDPRRSPRLAASQPPSPPPPRRSGEMRRETKPALPPPVNRAEKPLIPAHSRLSYFGDHHQVADLKNKIQQETSPFSSPPSSAGSAEDELPPLLPSRPRPHATQTDGLIRVNTLHVGFEPPPLHHSVATRRQEKGQEVHDPVKGRITPQLTGEQRPSLPMRPQTVGEPPARASTFAAAMKPPPRPPRPGVITAGPTLDNSFAPKRIVSTPTTQLPPPPTRLPSRANTVVDRTSERTFTDIRVAPSSSVSTAGATSTVGAASKLDPLGPGYPDPSNTNRRPPYIKQGVHEISTKYDPRVFDVCGKLVCTTGGLTRVWSLLDGELLMSFSHGEGVKATSIIFKPGASVEEEGQRVWIGNNMGELMEADVMTESIAVNKPGAHGRHEVIRIYRHYNELWSLDESGALLVWGPDASGVPNLANNPHQTFRLPRGHAFSMVVGDELWHATGKEIRVFAPTTDGQTQFQVLVRPLLQDICGEVTSGCLIGSQAGKAFFGHNDGKISIYATKDYSCLNVLNISSFKINALAGVGNYMWAGFNTGKVCVYDMEETPWAVKKDWQAHDNPVVKLIADPASYYCLDRLQVVSLGADNMLRAWDGLLQDDWQETEMKAHDAEYCGFEDIKAMVMTWNAGASTPHSLRYADQDATFIRSLLHSSDSPDILVFGFQELVDLEDKTATAKRLFKSKKKEGSDQERMSHQYRDWRDFLLKSLDEYMPRDDLYHLLHTATLVGLFTCIFVKSTIRDRISNLSAAEVKRGMGGLHGNKGAIVVRFMIDDTSLCFINCHLAAGQSQANSRHNDIAAILEAPILPAERDQSVRIDSYAGGGDGTMILDHELCVLNGDLNYRIDTMSRDTVVIAVKQNNLAKLLERDQLLVARRRNAAFRLRAFDEMPITFAPTYKYDVGTDNYDTSEKKRSPAWCDRLLYRGHGKITQLDYRRHEVRVSDHRPVTGRFKFTIKKIEPKARALTWMDCQQRFEDLRQRLGQDEKLAYLTNVIGYDSATARGLIRPKKDRSPSRHREKTTS